jgi:ubiquinone/menaquinone biosynthesis C-methylase UbiE
MKNIDYTGERLERFVTGDSTIEHLHRYSSVLNIVQNQTVLDIACGEGYGSNLMASYAKQVIGVDISTETISEAKSRYNKINLTYKEGEVDKIPLPDHYVDVIICFETIEHHLKHKEMLAEFIRVLKPDGMLIMSTPDKSITDTWKNHFNKYHVKELYTPEFKALVQEYFMNVRYYKQRIVIGSLIVPEEGVSDFCSYNGSFDSVTVNKGLYNSVFNICVASNSDLTSLPASFYDGQDIIFEQSYKKILRNTSYYKFAYPVLHIFVIIKNFLNKIK